LGTLLNARAQEDKSVAGEAVEALQKACDLAPGDVLAPRYNLGLAFWNAGQPDDARKSMEQVVKAGPEGHKVVRQAREALEAIRSAQRPH
jgi:hypothetical protein